MHLNTTDMLFVGIGLIVIGGYLKTHVLMIQQKPFRIKMLSRAEYIRMMREQQR